jgi:hypothetical protein
MSWTIAAFAIIQGVFLLLLAWKVRGMRGRVAGLAAR